MSRINDNDDQRIREMQESDLRTRKDLEKKDNESRLTKSFQEVMQQRTQKQTAQQLKQKDQSKEQSGETKKEEKSFAESMARRLPKQAADVQKRAALSKAMAQGMESKRSEGSQKLREAEAERGEDLVKKADDDKDRLDKDLRVADDADSKKADDSETSFKKQNAEADAKAERENNEGRSRGRRDQNSEDQTPQRAKGIEAATAPKADPAAKVIPPEVIEAMVNAIQKAVTADGRTEMHVELKGSMFNGVRLKVKAERGKVTCTFEGADRELKNLLESSKGALMRGLEKRGLTLTSLKVV
jgi:hypothetical protein